MAPLALKHANQQFILVLMNDDMAGSSAMFYSSQAKARVACKQDAVVPGYPEPT